jgi:hypothetical protein
VPAVEVLADHPRVEQDPAVIEHERGDLVERVHREHGIVRHRHGDDLALQRHGRHLVGLVEHDHHLAHERRAR